MKKIVDYIVAYSAWVADMGLALWFAYLCKFDLLGFLALFYERGNWIYEKQVNVIDKAFTIFLGLGWMAFMIVAEEYFRIGIQKKDLLKRITRINAPLLISIFVVDLFLLWLQGIGSSDWLRLLILVAELGAGLALLVWSKTRLAPKPN